MQENTAPHPSPTELDALFSCCVQFLLSPNEGNSQSLQQIMKSRTSPELAELIRARMTQMVSQQREVERIIKELKDSLFPGSTYVGPFEKLGVPLGVLEEQWLWNFRDHVRGTVLTMSSPYGINADLYDRPEVTKVIVSDLCEERMTKGGFSSKTDVIGDFCATPAPMEDNSVDTILCLSVLEHCEDPFAMVANLGRIVRPGGYIFLKTPFAYVDGHMDGDYWRFCQQGYQLMAKKAGIEPIHVGALGEVGHLLRQVYGAALSYAARGIPSSTWMIARRPLAS